MSEMTPEQRRWAAKYDIHSGPGYGVQDVTSQQAVATAWAEQVERTIREVHAACESYNGDELGWRSGNYRTNCASESNVREHGSVKGASAGSCITTTTATSTTRPTGGRHSTPTTSPKRLCRWGPCSRTPTRCTCCVVGRSRCLFVAVLPAGLRFHSLRHTYANLCAAVPSISVRQVAEWMRHANPTRPNSSTHTCMPRANHDGEMAALGG